MSRPSHFEGKVLLPSRNETKSVEVSRGYTTFISYIDQCDNSTTSAEKLMVANTILQFLATDGLAFFFHPPYIAFRAAVLNKVLVEWLHAPQCTRRSDLRRAIQRFMINATNYVLEKDHEYLEAMSATEAQSDNPGSWLSLVPTEVLRTVIFPYLGNIHIYELAIFDDPASTLKGLVFL